MLRDMIISSARSYLGTPFQHQGRTRYGLDCVGLLIRVAHDLKLSTFDVSHYGRVPSGRMMQRVLGDVCDPVALNELQSGDIIHMAFDTQPQHLAIITPYGMVHADNQRGVIEHRIDDKWFNRVRGCYAFPGVDA